MFSGANRKNEMELFDLVHLILLNGSWKSDLRHLLHVLNIQGFQYHFWSEIVCVCGWSAHSTKPQTGLTKWLVVIEQMGSIIDFCQM
jgi:hypothetical protein